MEPAAFGFYSRLCVHDEAKGAGGNGEGCFSRHVGFTPREDSRVGLEWMEKGKLFNSTELFWGSHQEESRALRQAEDVALGKEEGHRGVAHQGSRLRGREGPGVRPRTVL